MPGAKAGWDSYSGLSSQISLSRWRVELAVSARVKYTPEQDRDAYDLIKELGMIRAARRLRVTRQGLYQRIQRAINIHKTIEIVK